MNAPADTELTVAAWPGLTPRLLTVEPEGADVYTGIGGYAIHG